MMTEKGRNERTDSPDEMLVIVVSCLSLIRMFVYFYPIEVKTPLIAFAFEDDFR